LPKAHDVDEGTLTALMYAQVEAAAAHLALFKPCDVLARFMAYTGLRAREVAGLRVRDVDLAAGHVSVRQTAQHIMVPKRDEDPRELIEQLMLQASGPDGLDLTPYTTLATSDFLTY
jgi:integrase